MNAEKRIVLVIDMQNDFITGTLGTAEARRIVPAVAARIEAERAAGAMLVFTRDTHGNDYMQSLEGKLLPVAHCEQGSAGWALAPEIAPFAEGARIIDKPTFGCIALPELLRPHVGRKRNSCLWAFARTSAWCRTHSFCGLISREIVSLSRRIAARASRLKAMRRRSLQ